ncbi:hypothetical protein K432DRAFT_379393 [Lepidopterella palustris CBS 459.81]|uniref:Uncharacterized protein n=1 Tax=Lepidopterella palustris CBS 459.81 TaxID=1314670 RepID=A0A8E2EHA2_9PEZI|nr:hypothetical protein K432DRAFT_379393 [Lepidopterella palustris CBS 459.81]
MDAGSSEVHGRRFTLALSTLALSTHSLSALALQYFPSDPLNVAFNFSIYSIWAAVLSLLGCIGAAKRSSTLVTIFTHHLFFDALVSTLPRVLLIPALASIPEAICAEVEYQRAILSPQDAQHMFGFWTAGKCRAGLWALQGLVALTAVAMTGVQWWCAWRVREYARTLDEESLGLTNGMDITLKKNALDVENCRVGFKNAERAAETYYEDYCEKGACVRRA